MSPDEPLTPAPPRYTPEHHYDPVPVRDPGFKEVREPFKLSLRQRMGFWLIKKALGSATEEIKMRLPVNWRTTLLGLVDLLSTLGAIATAAKAAFDGNPATVPDWSAILTLLGIGGAARAGGFALAKDKAVTGIGKKATSDPALDATCVVPNQK